MFKRPERVECQLLHNHILVGRQKSNRDIWEIDFPYRLFVKESQLPNIGNGAVYFCWKHLRTITFPTFLAFCFFYFISFQIVFPSLYIKIRPTRVNVFAAIFCFISVLFAILANPAAHFLPLYPLRSQLKIKLTVLKII